MTSNECKIDVFVRRTGETVSVKVIPSVTTYGDIIREICKKRKALDPDHYFIALNYSTELSDDAIFDESLKYARFQMFMKTKWLMEHIAEQAIQKKQLKEDVREELEIESSQIEISRDEFDEKPMISFVPTAPPLPPPPSPPTSSSPSPPPSPPVQPPEKKPLLTNVVQSAIQRIPRQDVQEYLHNALGKAFDILLMGSPRVGKSTLINAILKKNLAKTSAGRNACTTAISYYEYEEIYTSPAENSSTTTSTCSIRIWDAPGIEDWTKLDVAEYVKGLIQNKNPICLIYCVSPGSYADLDHVKIIIEVCRKFQVFVALVVTNMYASDEVDDILVTFQALLATQCPQTKAVDDVFHYGKIGLCTLVNSVEYEAQGVLMRTAGVDELMLGIMNSLSEEKLLQWCFALMDNGPFWMRAQSRIWKALSYVKNWIGY